jgi:hypothetical protein
MTKDEALRLALWALEYRGTDSWRKRQPAITAIKAALEAKGESVAVWELFEDGWDSIADPEWMESLPVGTKLYTIQPQRTWMGLTDEEMQNLWNRDIHMELLRAIEAKLEEKNG